MSLDAFLALNEKGTPPPNVNHIAVDSFLRRRRNAGTLSEALRLYPVLQVTQDTSTSLDNLETYSLATWKGLSSALKE